MDKNPIFKIQIFKTNEFWICNLMFLATIKEARVWIVQDTVKAEDYGSLMKQAADKNWIDILNNTSK